MPIELDYEPGFLEEAVRRALIGRPEARLFHRQRETVYWVDEAEDRARAFTVLDARWFARLGLGKPIETALAEQPTIPAEIARCAVGRPRRPREAGAELLVRETEEQELTASGRVLRLLIDPELLVNPELLPDRDSLIDFLRRELAHVADMLDPTFGYQPRLPSVIGPAAERQQRERYRVLWDITIDGRLMRAGKLPARVRERRWLEFSRSFAALGARAAEVFGKFFDDPKPTHATIVAQLVEPGMAERTAASACPLCGFPATDLSPGELNDDLIEEIARDFPGWRPEHRCCRQCGDLYRASRLSRASAAALPGIR